MSTPKKKTLHGKKRRAAARMAAAMRTAKRIAADAAREDAAKNGPTVRDRDLAERWYPLLVGRELTQHDLAALLTAVRFDVEYVRQVEAELSRVKHGNRSTANGA
jgi:hypothetical protein